MYKNAVMLLILGSPIRLAEFTSVWWHQEQAVSVTVTLWHTDISYMSLVYSTNRIIVYLYYILSVLL